MAQSRNKHRFSHRTKRMAEPEELLVIQTLNIVDKKSKKKQSKPLRPTTAVSSQDFNRNVANVHGVEEGESSSSDIFREVELEAARCVDDTSLIAGAIVFLVFQVRFFLSLKIKVLQSTFSVTRKKESL